MINKRKFERFRAKVLKAVGTYNTDVGLGYDLIIRKYTYTVNNYGDRILTYDSSADQTCKGVIETGTDDASLQVQDINVREGEFRVYIPYNIIVEDTATDHYVVYMDEKEYNIGYISLIGKVANMNGILKQLTISPIQTNVD